MITRTVSGRTYTYSHSIGQAANNGVGFRCPMDLAGTSNGEIYVLSRGDQAQTAGTRVTKCTFTEEYLLEFGRLGSGDGEFMCVTSIAVDKDSKVYVADEWLNRISVFDKDGSFLCKWGIPGSGDGELNRPWGLAFDEEESLSIVDSGNNRLQKFTKDGTFLAKWGSGGSSDGEFDMPWGITIDAQGSVYVADWHNSRVQKFTPDGQYLMSFGAPGSGQGELRRPTGVAVDEEGDVYVVDWVADAVHAYGPDGLYLTTFRGDARQPSKWGQQLLDAGPDYRKARNRAYSLEPEWGFCYPVAIEVDLEGRIAIVDQQRSRLQVYIKEKDYIEPQFNL